SITIVTLSLASTQYTPRILRNFMRDRANQFVLGIFVAVFTYCLIVLRTIRNDGDEGAAGFVPLLAVAFGMLSALLAIACLIFFIHHIASSIQASTILKAITDETLNAIEKLFPKELGESMRGDRAASPAQDSEWLPVFAENNGYLQHIDQGELLQLAEKEDALLRLEQAPGDFVYSGARLVSANKILPNGAVTALQGMFIVGDFRSVDQDAAFGVRQIVDIALKALSPGVNDTSTAVSCLDYLGAILCQITTRREASPLRGKDGELRVIAPVQSFADFVALSFDQIRLSANGNVTILRHILRVIGRVADTTIDETRRATLLTQARLIIELADSSVSSDYDRASINIETRALGSVLNVDHADLPSLDLRRQTDALSEERD
ncbi:MAG: DUF2254 domain-containing protein, partial [Verrucomicrobiaceae bacterium]